MSEDNHDVPWWPGILFALWLLINAIGYLGWFGTLVLLLVLGFIIWVIIDYIESEAFAFRMALWEIKWKMRKLLRRAKRL
jgi:hypothetical protein